MYLALAGPGDRQAACCDRMSIAGTAAMFLVGGGILTHNVPALHHAIEAIEPAGPLPPPFRGLKRGGRRAKLAGWGPWLRTSIGQRSRP